MPSLDFGVSRHGERIDRLSTSSGVQTGITFDVQMKGVVPFFEEYDAMVAANYNSTEWKGLRSEDRAEAVARYRLRKHIEVHVADAVDLHVKMRRKK